MTSLAGSSDRASRGPSPGGGGTGRYGLLRYRGHGNLGDEIQSIAAERFLPRVDRRVDRDELHRDTRLPEPLFLLMNGWFGNEPRDWPPHPSIHPAFVAFHVARPELAHPRFAPFYREHEPIGCRDLATVALLQGIGVEAWFSGCLTLTLKNACPARTDAVYMVDVPPSLEEHVPRLIRERARRVTHRVRVPACHGSPPRSGTRRGSPASWLLRSALVQSWKVRRARALLRRYMEARLVITSRLHCALPCLAFGTPTVVLRESWRDGRWLGYGELLNAFSAKTVSRLDWENVPVRSPSALAAPLEARVREALQGYRTRYGLEATPPSSP